jgi:uncharacterized protein
VTPASAVYEGWVRHRRLTPVARTFRYPLFLMYLDLDELPGVLERSRLWSLVARFDRADHLGDPRRPLRDEVLDLVQERTGRRPAGPVRVLTQLRHYGVAFNLVSFYYCFEPSGELAAVAAQVTNTPWGERHAYVLADRVGKELHVSPLLPMDREYACRVTTPRRALQVHIAAPPEFDATLSLLRREIEPAVLRRLLVRYPAPPLTTLARIYLQALRLKLRGVSYHPHPAR